MAIQGSQPYGKSKRIYFLYRYWLEFKHKYKLFKVNLIDNLRLPDTISGQIEWDQDMIIKYKKIFFDCTVRSIFFYVNE